MPPLLARLALLLAGCTTAAAAAAAAATAPAAPFLAPQAQALPWWNGPATWIGEVLNCNVWDTSPRVGAYAGFTLVPPSFWPAVGEVFYTHLVIAHIGNPCAPSAVGIELLLPPGVAPAISSYTPVFCLMIDPITNSLIDLATDPGYGCPQVLPPGLEGHALIPPLGGIGGSGAWGMHFGFWLELMVPLRAAAPQPGNGAIAWRVNPDVGVIGYPQVSLYVTGEVIFRDGLETGLLLIDSCGAVQPLPSGC